MNENLTIQVFEQENLRIGDRGFQRRHWELLARWAEKQEEGYLQIGVQGVRFHQWVGVVEVEDLVIEILPKVERFRGADTADAVHEKWRRILLRLLGVAGYLDVRSLDEATLGTQRWTILDVLFAQFLDSVEILIREGLVKRYRSVLRNRGAVKGRIDHAANLRENAFHAERICTVAFEYDRLNLPNLILKAGVETCARYAPAVYSRNRARGTGLYFSDWPSYAVSQADFDALRFDRKNERYHKALNLARLILGRQNPDIARGRERVFSLLFDMNDLWEAAIVSRLRRECTPRAGCTLRRQQAKVFWRSDMGTPRTIRPDIVIEPGDGKKVIVDTKWKTLSPPVPGDQDLRQIFAYDVLWDADDGYLLYPKVEGSENAGGAFKVVVNGSELRCSVLFAEVDPASWGEESLLASLCSRHAEGSGDNTAARPGCPD